MVVGHPSYRDDVGAELGRDLVGDAPGEVVAEDRIGEDVVGQTVRSGR